MVTYASGTFVITLFLTVIIFSGYYYCSAVSSKVEQDGKLLLRLETKRLEERKQAEKEEVQLENAESQNPPPGESRLKDPSEDSLDLLNFRKMRPVKTAPFYGLVYGDQIRKG